MNELVLRGGGGGDPQPPTGSADELRAFIGENMALARIQAELAERYTEVGDDAGLEYALRRFAAYSKAAFTTLADFKLANNGRRA